MNGHSTSIVHILGCHFLLVCLLFVMVMFWGITVFRQLRAESVFFLPTVEHLYIFICRFDSQVIYSVVSPTSSPCVRRRFGVSMMGFSFALVVVFDLLCGLYVYRSSSYVKVKNRLIWIIEQPQRYWFFPCTESNIPVAIAGLSERHSFTDSVICFFSSSFPRDQLRLKSRHTMAAAVRIVFNPNHTYLSLVSLSLFFSPLIPQPYY